MGGIFLNYRTADQALGAVLLDQKLSEHFGEKRVFRDDRSLAPGDDFADILWGWLRTSEVLLAIMGPHWLDRDAAGRRLIDNEKDFIRREIAEALRIRLRVVPVLLGGVALPARTDLPKGLKRLARLQYLEIRARDPEPDIDRLIRRLERILPRSPGAGAGPEPARHRPPSPDAGAESGPPAGQQWNVYVRGSVRAKKDVVMRDKTVDRRKSP